MEKLTRLSESGHWERAWWQIDDAAGSVEGFDFDFYLAAVEELTEGVFVHGENGQAAMLAFEIAREHGLDDRFQRVIWQWIRAAFVRVSLYSYGLSQKEVEAKIRVEWDLPTSNAPPVTSKATPTVSNSNKAIREQPITLKSERDARAGRLAEAVRSDDYNSCLKLISEGMPLTSSDSSLLCLARSPKIIELLCKHGLDPNGHSRGRPLHNAVARDDSKSVAALIACGARVDITDYYGNIPLHHAKSVLVANQLLKVDSKVDEPNNSGMTPLHLAIIDLNVDVVTFLLDNGADINRTSVGLRGAMRALKRTIDEGPRREAIHSLLQVQIKTIQGEQRRFMGLKIWFTSIALLSFVFLSQMQYEWSVYIVMAIVFTVLVELFFQLANHEE